MEEQDKNCVIASLPYCLIPASVLRVQTTLEL
jgi:hypothetical protein